MPQTLDSLFQRYQTTLNLRSHRQEVLASNISNADTPGYKARDFDFGQALTRALGAEGQSSGGRLSLSAADEGSAAFATSATPASLAVSTGASASAGQAALPGEGGGLLHTAAGHLGASAFDPVGHALAQSAAELKYRQSVQDSVDGNTVDMDVERAAFADNALHYEASLTQLSSEIKNLNAAMQSA